MKVLLQSEQRGRGATSFQPAQILNKDTARAPDRLYTSDVDNLPSPFLCIPLTSTQYIFSSLVVCILFFIFDSIYAKYSYGGGNKHFIS